MPFRDDEEVQAGIVAWAKSHGFVLQPVPRHPDASPPEFPENAGLERSSDKPMRLLPGVFRDCDGNIWYSRSEGRWEPEDPSIVTTDEPAWKFAHSKVPFTYVGPIPQT